jgi:hypothetical protein
MVQRMIAGLGVVVLLAACASTVEKDMAAWVGRTDQDVINRWGVPDKSESDGRGGKILTYHKRMLMAGGVVNTQDRDRGIKGEEQTYRYKKERVFWINPTGIVYDYEWAGI